jgi:hypothetical protein
MTLYELGNEVKALEDLIESCTTDEQGNPKEPTEEEAGLMLAMIEEYQEAFESKAERICKFRANLMASAKAMKDEEERLAKRRKATELKAEALKWILETVMERTKMDKVEAGIFRVRFQKNPPSVFVTRESDIPAEFWKIIPETRQLDKRLILDELKTGGQVPGASLVQGRSLRIE